MKNPGKASEYFDTEAIKSGIKKKAIRGGGAMLVSRGTGLTVHTVTTIVLARLLTPDDFGLVTMVTAFSLLFYNVGINGFREAIIQKEDIKHRQVSTLFWIGLALSTGLAIIFSACSPLLARFYKEPRLIPIATALSVGFIFSALATEHIALITRNMQFSKLMFNEITAEVICAGLAIGMALSGYGYWAIVARHLSRPIVSAILAWIQCSWRPGLPAKDPELWPLIKFSYKTFSIFLLNYFGRNLDKILLGRKWGSQQLGYYDRAYHLFVMPTNQLIIPLSGVALATLSRLRNDPDRYKTYFIKSLTLLTLIGMLVSVILTINGRDIILFLLGPRWAETGKIFSALSPAIGMTVISGTIGWLHLSLGNPGRWLRWGILSLILTTLAIIVGLQFGALGVAIAYSLSFYIITWPGLWYAARPIGLRMGTMFKAIWRFFSAALLSGLGAWWIFNNVPSVLNLTDNVHILIRIGFVSVSCTLLYVATLIILYGRIKPLLDIVIVLKTLLPESKAGKTK